MSRNLIVDSWFCRAVGFLLGTSIALNAWAGDTSVTVGDASVTVTGASTVLNFPVTRTGDLSYDAYLSYQTQDGSAASGTDYAPAQGSLLLPAGVATLNLPVAVKGNNATVPDKSFSLNLLSISTVSPNFALSSPQTFATAAMPYVIAVVDVNGDGKPDLIVADYASGEVGVLINTTLPGATTPSFAPEQVFSVGRTTFAVAVADMNGDGKPDIVASDLNDGTLSVLLNTTAPGATMASFASAQSFTLQTGTAAMIAVADLNGDGKPDLVVGGNADAVMVLINNTATDSSTVDLIQQLVTVGNNASSMYVAAADMNGDGLPDLIVTDGTLNTVSVLLNATPTGAQTVSFSEPLVLNTGSAPTMCAAADLNGDGKLDLIVANDQDDTLSVFLNTIPYKASPPSFAAPQVFAVAGNPRSVLAADVDGDGRPDLVVGYDSAATNGVSVLLNTAEPGAAAASFAPLQTFGATPSSYFVAAGDINGDGLTDIVAGSGDNAVVFLNATTPGVASTVNLSPMSLAFGNQALAVTSAAQTVTLTNNASTPLSVTSIAATGPYAQTNTCGSSVVAGASCTISVTFTPTAVGAQNGSIAITDNALGSPQTLALSGTGMGTPVVSLSPASLSFGNQAVDSAGAAQTVTLTNTGNGTLDLTGIAASGQFAETNTCGSSVMVGASCTISVTFTPTAVGAQSGSISMTDNAADSPQTLGLSGTGTGSAVSLSPTSLAFASQGVGGASTAQTVMLTNTGNLVLSMTSMVVTGPFAQTNTCGASVAAGMSCTISVTFTPEATGPQSGSIDFIDNASGSPQTLSLSGSGTGAVVGLSTTSLTFASEPLGSTSAAQTVTLTNIGTVTLSVTSIVASAQYAETNTCGSSVAAGGSCTISVTFTPAASGPQSGSIAVTDNAGNSPQTLSLSGTGTGSAVSLSPVSLSFGNQVVGSTSAPQTVTLTNTGALALSVTGIAASAQYAETNTCGTSVAAGASCTISVTFVPTASGSQSGSITVTDNAAGSPQTLTLSGTGTQSAVTLSPVSLAFSGQLVGTTSAAQTVTLTNSGNLALNLTSIVASAQYVETNTCGSSVAAGASCTISVTFTPVASGNQNGSITITDNVANSPQTLSLSGTGTGAAASLSPTSLTFGSQVLGTTSTAQTVTLTNTGNAALNVANIVASGPYTQTNSCGSSVAAGASCTISVTFTPTSTGSQNGSITITDNAGDSPETVNLSGTGTGAVASLAPASLNFGNQGVGTNSAAQTVTLTNTGNAALSVTSIVANGPYTETNTCGASVVAGTNCTISVTFTPSFVGAQNGTIIVTDNAANSPQTLGLSGTGAGAAVNLSITNLSFANQMVSTTSAAQTVLLTNTGNAALNMASVVASTGYAETNTCGMSVGAGASCTISVTFTPTVVGAQNGSVTITDNAADSPETLALSGAGTGATVSLSPTSLTFGSQAVGNTSTPQAVTLTNTGNVAVSVTSIVASAQFAETNTCGASVVAGASCTISVTFVPTATGSQSGSLTFTDSGPGSPQTVSLNGTGTGAVAGVSPASLTFASQAVGTTSAAQTVTLTNTGNAALSITSIVASSQYAETNTCGTSVAAGANCTISVTFAPTAVGAQTGSLTITDNAAGSPQTISLSGAGIQGVAGLSSTGLAFGNQNVGTTSAAQVVTLTNSSSVALSLSSITASGPYAQTNTCGSSVGAGANCAISVTFTPTASGSQSGSVTLTDNAADSPQTISLSGTGLQPVASLSSTSLAFGNQNVGSTSTAQTVTLTNSGSGSLIVSIATNGPYAQTNTCGASVAAGTNCTISVTFTPIAVGSQIGSVTITDNAANTPQTIGLTGTGMDQAATVNNGTLTGLIPNVASNGTLSATLAYPSQALAFAVVTGPNHGTVSITNVSTGAFTYTPYTNYTGGDNFTFAATDSFGTVSNTGFESVTVSDVAATVNNGSLTTTVGASVTGTLSATLAYANQILTFSLFSNPSHGSVNITNASTGAFTYTPTPGVPYAGPDSFTFKAIDSFGLASNLATERVTVNDVAATANNGSLSAQPSGGSNGTLSATPAYTGQTLTFALVTSPSHGSVTITNTGTGAFTYTPTTGYAGSDSFTFAATDSFGTPSNTATESVTVIPMAVASLSTTNLVFGNQNIGTTSAAQTVTLTNSGNAALSITSIVASVEFAQTNTCGSSVAAGASCTISVTFSPTNPGGGQLGNITITDGATDSPQTVGLNGTGIGPLAILSPVELQFGNQAVGTTSAAQTVTMTNTGNAALSIASITLPSGPYTQTNTCGTSVAAGASCTFSVTFTPTSIGEQSTFITITDNTSNGTHHVALAGIGTGAVAGLSPTSLTFASQAPGTTSAAQVVTLSNSGNASLSITSILASAQFAQTNTCGSSLAAGTNCTISVTFTPTATGAQSGSITLTDNAADSPQTVVLSGTGGQPAVTLSPASLTFANTFVGIPSAAQSVTLTNTGNFALNLSSIAASGPYAQTNTCGSSVAAGASCTISVTFTPTAIGVQTGSITLTDNAADSPETVSLSGTGKEAVVTLSQTSAAWLARTIDTTSATRTVTITNTGNATLGHPTMSLSGTNPGQFAQTNTCTTNLGAGGSCTVTLTFTPTSDGAKTALLLITDTASDSPQSVTLSASGLVAGASLSPGSPQAFANTVVNRTSAAKTVTLTNSGGDGGTLSGINVTLTGTNAIQFTESDNCSTLDQGASCTVTVNFAPTTTGSMTATLHFTYDGTVHGGASQNITLTGTGVSGGGGTGPGCPPAPEQCQ